MKMKIKIEDEFIILEPHDQADAFIMGRISVNIPTKYDEVTNKMKKEIRNFRIKDINYCLTIKEKKKYSAQFINQN